MLGLEYVRSMARYNRWMNGRLYEMCAALPDAERKRDRAAFFKSIHGTLNHLLLGDSIWMGRFLGRPYAATSLAQELYADFGELRGARESMDESIVDWARRLAQPDLERDLVFMSVVNPQERRYPMWFAVAHFFNHQTHHRGQLTTLMSQCGIDPGITDLLWLPESGAK